MTNLKWKVLYIDGSTFSTDDGDPCDAPGGGVLAVAQEDNVVGVAIHQGNDFYVFHEQYGGWYGLDHFGFTQFLMRPGLKVVKLGESMTTARYKELLKSLRDDPGFPNKSARYPWERHF